jgi:hypothetical protein
LDRPRGLTANAVDRKTNQGGKVELRATGNANAPIIRNADLWVTARRLTCKSSVREFGFEFKQARAEFEVSFF